MVYDIASRDYLERAREQLDKATIVSLFYAAFELRCGIENRMREYLEAWDHISRKVKEGWQIAKLAKNIEKAFKIGDKVVEVVIRNSEAERPLYVCYYTPVSSKLKKMGEKIGDLMHAMKKLIPENDRWWKETRNYLEQVYAELAKANSGTLLGPPLIDKKTGHINMVTTVKKDEKIEDIKKAMQPNKRVMFRVKYLADIPVKFTY